MGENVSRKLIGSHLIEGRMEAEQEIDPKIDQTPYPRCHRAWKKHSVDSKY